ncbi:FecCD family ABC transporter permease [Halobacillus seohaensis]|uniref:FecCD family ABC transporter permease n=1 Tax=Halobacillus seohaensis TaxID=447421 RepID=A0ABW2EQT2_9BACI
MGDQASFKHQQSHTYKIWLTFVLAILLLFVSFIASLSIGAYRIDFLSVITYLFHHDESEPALIIHSIRMPRAIIGMIIGACLAMAGAMMQAITNNPLASPQIFGINAGASLMVVITVVLFPDFSPTSIVYFAFVGAALGGCIVYYMASTGGGMTPVKLALSGITIHMFLSSIIEGIVIFNETSTEDVLFWLAGGIDGRNWTDVQIIMPWFLVGLVLAFGISRSLTILSLGDDVARGLGQKIALIRIVTAILVIILAGASVAIAGPIGFVGLIVPHIARKLVGSDYRLIIPASGLLGGVLLNISDVVSRFVSFPSESPVGIVTALIGAPFFLYLARRGGRSL